MVLQTVQCPIEYNFDRELHAVKVATLYLHIKFGSCRNMCIRLYRLILIEFI
jgi:hypothetical protein